MSASVDVGIGTGIMLLDEESGRLGVEGVTGSNRRDGDGAVNRVPTCTGDDVGMKPSGEGATTDWKVGSGADETGKLSI